MSTMHVIALTRMIRFLLKLNNYALILEEVCVLDQDGWFSCLLVGRIRENKHNYTFAHPWRKVQHCQIQTNHTSKTKLQVSIHLWHRQGRGERQKCWRNLQPFLLFLIAELNNLSQYCLGATRPRSKHCWNIPNLTSQRNIKKVHTVKILLTLIVGRVVIDREYWSFRYWQPYL